MGEVEMSNLESSSDGDGGSCSTDKDPGSGSKDEGEEPVDMMYAPLGFAPSELLGIAYFT